MSEPTADECVAWLEGVARTNAGHGWQDAANRAEAASLHLRRLASLERDIRAIELRVDSLNTKAYPQRQNTQDVLDAIKATCRLALTQEPK